MKRRWLFLFAFLLVPFSRMQASEVFSFVEGQDSKYIGKFVSIFTDPTGKLGLKDVSGQRTLFKSCKEDVPNLGLSQANRWIRFSVKNLSDQERLVVNLSHPNIDEVTFYRRYEDGSVDSSRVQLGKRSEAVVYPHQFYLFEIDIKKNQQVECYFKLFSNTQLSVPISIYSTEGILQPLLTTDIFSAIYIGLMLAMILYNIFLYFSTREPHYHIYVNYVFWVAIAQMAVLGLLNRFLIVENTWVASRLLTFSGAMSGIAAIFFVKSFLQTAKDSPRFNILLNIFLMGYAVAIALLIGGFIAPAHKMVNVVAGGGSTIVLVLAFELSRKKFRQTRYFLFAWCVFLIGVLVYVLKDYNVLPYNFFTLRAVQIGAVFEAILLSFALGDKINIYRKEKDESQARELAISLEHARLIREQNVVLEQKVEERTRALTETNESLQVTLTHLKEAQSQLVQAEKMASLGQLTAGVAHEINNPINFVTSNVGPLKRDVNMLWETLEEVERIALTEDLSLSAKRSKILAYKEEMDIDYLKTEIDFLLKGMHDGAYRTAEIVKSLRIFSRVDEDVFKYADINEGLESTMVIIGSLIRDGIDVKTRLGELPPVECHSGKLNQVFLNILTNAVYAINKRYPEKKGGELSIETGVNDEDETVFIKISDNGIGIPAEIQDKIFEPFFTTKGVGEGTGLGMSIAYNTIARHHGKIEIDSEVGSGTTFKLVLPVNQPK